jgi:hypothetical protein
MIMKRMPAVIVNQNENPRMRARISWVVLILLGFSWSLLGVSATAQGGQGFTGHVLDSTGAVIPGAEVTIHNQATNVEEKAVTTSAGDYTVPYIIPGTYTISVVKNGFEVEKKTDILLNVDQASTIDFRLSPGAVTQTVTVNGSAAQIDRSKADRGEVIDSQRISETALDSRNPFGLFGLSPGTHNFSATQYPRPFDIVSRNLYANGSPQPADLNLDGVTNTAGGNAGYAGIVPSVDALKEYKVNLNPYDASFAKGAGNSIDMSLKSGGNKFHGVADYFMRRSWLDAYPYQVKYNHVVDGTPLAKPPHKRDQYSVEADGPLIIPHLFNGRDKVFYTVSYEYIHDVQPNGGESVYSIPSPAMIAGDFSQAQFEYYYTTADKFNPCPNAAPNCAQPLNIYDPLQPLSTYVDPLDGQTKSARQQFPGNIIPASRISSVGAAILATYKYITPNVNPGPNYAPYTNNYEVLQGEDDIWRNALIKVDYHVGPKDDLSFRWSAQARWENNGVPPVPLDDPAEESCPGIQPKSETGAAQWTHIFSPTLLLNVAATVISTVESESICGTTFPFNEKEALGFSAAYVNQLPNNNHFPNINPSGPLNAANYDDFGPNGTGGSGIDHTLQFLPTITKIIGAQTIRAGMDIRFNQFDNPFGGSNDQYNFTNDFTQHYFTGGQYTVGDAPNYTSGSSIAELLLGYPSSGSTSTTVNQFFSQHYLAPWVQDDWRITKRLTLNLGLRWDFATAPVERHNKENGIFNTSVLNPISSSIPAGTAALGTATELQGGLQFVGVGGQPRGTYYTNMLQVQPRIGFAYALTDRLSLHGGVGENYLSDRSTNGDFGFYGTTTYNPSTNNGLTPYTATNAGGFSDPILVVEQPTGSSLGYLEALGQSISFFNPHYHIPSVWNYSVELQAQVSKRDVVTMAYVGNREPNGAVTNNINNISPQWDAQCDLERGGNHNLCDSATGQIANPFLGIPAFQGTSYYNSSTLSKSVFTQPYPEFGSISENGATNNYRAWYNSFQASYSRQMSHSLSLHVAYTHALAETAGGWTDELNNVVSRNISDTNDVKHAVSISGVGYLPFGRGRDFFPNVKRWVDEVINGWEVSPFYTWYSGFPWNPGGNWEMYPSGTAIDQTMGVKHVILPPDGSHPNTRIRGATPCVGQKDINYGLPGSTSPQVDVSASTTSEANCTSTPFVEAANYAVGRNTISYGVYQPGAYHFDLAASKNFAIHGVRPIFRSDVTNLRITVDLLNALNHADWDEGYNGLGVDFGTINKGPSGPTNLPRYLQLSAKLNW